jgi:hypothetical protein
MRVERSVAERVALPVRLQLRALRWRLRSRCGRVLRKFGSDLRRRWGLGRINGVSLRLLERIVFWRLRSKLDAVLRKRRADLQRLG